MANSRANDRARKNLASVLRDDLDACPEVDYATELYPGSVGDMYTMPFHTGDVDLFFKLWFVEAFGPPEMYARVLRTLRAVDDFWDDLAKMNAAAGGEPVRVSHRAVLNMKCRLVQAQYPTLPSVIDEAVCGAPLIAAHNVNRLIIGGRQWLVK